MMKICSTMQWAGQTPSRRRSNAECIRKLMHEQIKRGHMMRWELDRLLRQVEERIISLDKDINSALQNVWEGDAGRLTLQKEKAEAQRWMLKGWEAQSSHPLKHKMRITVVRAQLCPLLKLKQSMRDKLLRIKETKEFATKDKLLEEISDLEGASRGWFEEDNAFEAWLRNSRERSAAAGNPRGQGCTWRQARDWIAVHRQCCLAHPWRFGGQADRPWEEGIGGK
ncbi:hypothetical protein ACHAW5_001107 [Stephanodiscus triporus]|uniref:Uncharacterized protein n=1 Tax=Stephanodiscus triporus TaxID=2934178 RepID=A0ABD3PCX6_9STRA